MNIVLKDVCKAFGEKVVLDRFSHVFPEGKISFVLGPSGCGKTTLLRLICGLTAADSGEILGSNQRFSMVFQENRLLENLSAQKNVLLTARKDFGEKDAQALLRALGIEGAKDRVCTFSGGMKRRVAIARALAADCEVLLLDEPMSGLDEATADRVLHTIQKMTAQRTVIWVTHDRSYAKLMGGDILDFTRSEG